MTLEESDEYLDTVYYMEVRNKRIKQAKYILIMLVIINLVINLEDL